MSFIEKNGLKISSVLFDFVNKEVIPGTDIQPDKFWDGFEKTVHELSPINKRLIKKRETHLPFFFHQLLLFLYISKLYRVISLLLFPNVIHNQELLGF